MRKLASLVLMIGWVACWMISCHQKPPSVAPVDSQEPVSYNFQIRPILSDKCFNCHGPDANKRKAGLRLDLPDEAYKALQDQPDAHALVPNNPGASQVFLRVATLDTSLQMPPTYSHLPTLSPEEVELVRRWIRQGAKYEPHWAFVVPQKAALPSIQLTHWPHNEIDYFVLHQMESKGLAPNAEADRMRLLKRLSLDITGLLPSLELQQEFSRDSSEAEYEKVIDRLLADSAYGEHRAAAWMDLSRFADSHGYQDDNYRSAWPYRDWVIHALNQNMPYDQFVAWQLAGDQMPKPTKEQILATAFNRNHKITEEGGVIDEEYRVEYVVDRTNTFGRAFLGVSIECAKCHDHKYDPFSQKDYYRLFAFFNNVKEVGLESTVGGPETFAKNPRMQIRPEDLKGTLGFIHKMDTNKLEISIMADRDTPRKTYVLTRGNYDAPAAEVEPGTPKAILAFDPALPKNRYGLARWLFDPQNPLTARVFVNRLWQEIFGRGIVKSAADFGMQGDLPSHPALLDWLAVDFREHGWDMKRLLKQILCSSTYRQSSVSTTEKLKADPENIFLSRGPRFRMPAEMVRDMVLCSSGLLHPQIGGPSVKGYQPPGLWELASSGRGLLKTYEQDHGPALYRRGLYTFIKRTVPPPIPMIFDGSNRDQCEVRRLRTNTPLQALVMMNDTSVLEASRVLAANLLRRSLSPKKAISEAFQRILCRPAREPEIQTLQAYFQDRISYMQTHEGLADRLLSVGEYPRDPLVNAVAMASLAQVIQVLYNLDESITKS